MSSFPLFRLVETTGLLRGRPITSSKSFPEGVTLDRVKQIDAQMVRAFPGMGTITKATRLGS